MSIVLKVSTEKMNASANAVEAELTKVKGSFDDIDNIINRMNTYWEGDGANHSKAVYSNYKDDIMIIMAKINEQIRDLRQMAGVYEKSEREASQVGSGLPNDVIS